MNYCNCGENKGRCIDCAEEQLAATTKELSDVRAAAKAEVKRLFGDGEILRAALAAANEEIERLQEEPSALYYQLRDEARGLRESLDEATAALTNAREENERLTKELHDVTVGTSAVINEFHAEIASLREQLTEAQEGLAARVHRNLNTDIDELVFRNEVLTAENANLLAATRGKTFFHSDEEVNAEMGRLRAKVEELSARPLDQIIRAVMAHGYSCEEAADILSDYLHRREKIRQANALKESQ